MEQGERTERKKRVAAGRLPAVPLITCDPYFSVWSGSDCLCDTDTMHWTGRRKRITGIVRVDGVDHRFMGTGKAVPAKQTKLEVTSFFTRYCFEMAGVGLTVTFWTPLLLDDLDVLSRPCSYLDMDVCSLDSEQHQVEVFWEFAGELCCDRGQTEKVGGGSFELDGTQAAWLGLREQNPLGHSGDSITIDWGYLYLAVEESADREVSYCQERRCLCARFDFLPEEDRCGSASLVAAYDDIASICYFGRMLPGYWAREGKNILTAIAQAIRERSALMERCEAFEQELEEKTEAFGESYTRICHAAYRQSIAAHKLIADEEGKAVFISKECHSNGCAATVDVTYPSTPLFLIYNPELVRAMLRPVLRFAKMPVWGYDFAPHDVGRYPYVTGQVYGLQAYQRAAQEVGGGEENGFVYPMFCQMPESAGVYCLENQMPVEESGNLLILAAQLVRWDPQGEKESLQKNLPLYEKWVRYLLQYGSDPGEQLCTDDFAGHMAHNVNLAIKAIMGIEACSVLMGAAGKNEEAVYYHEKAAEMAGEVYERACLADHTGLTFGGSEESWSLKYNAVWDMIFESGLWSREFYEKESAYYRQKCNVYGVPLDSRAEYTKSDWMMWAAAMDVQGQNVEMFARCILDFLENSPDRVPFSDWYQTVSGRQQGFQNRTVQGGIFMPLFLRMTVSEN
jgi:hypothetical protein